MISARPASWHDAGVADVVVFIPAWNEEQNLPAVLDELGAELPAADVLVVDDGSTDATGEVARGQEDDDIGGLDWPLVDASGSPRQTLERSTAFLAPVRISLREDTE